MIQEIIRQAMAVLIATYVDNRNSSDESMVLGFKFKDKDFKIKVSEVIKHEMQTL